MKRTLKFSLIGMVMVLLACTNIYAQFPGWFWFPQYNGCASGNCYRGCSNGRCGVKKEAVKTEPVTENKSLVKEDDSAVKTAEFTETNTEEPVQTAEYTEEQTEKVVPESNNEQPVKTFKICPFAARVLELINWHRMQVGLPPFTVDESLVIGCQNHSRYMASYGFGHAYGIGGMECIAMGVNSPESVVNMWLNSSGHRAIIMSHGKKFGFGSFGTFHTLRVR